MKPTIEITRTNEPVPDKAWRAVIRLPKVIDWKGAGYIVRGALTEDGAWVEGFGFSPDQAVQMAMTAIGRAIVGMVEHEPEPAKDGQKP